PNISRITLYQSPALFSRHRRRSQDTQRPAPDHNLRPTTRRAPALNPRRLRPHPPRSVWHRDEEQITPMTLICDVVAPDLRIMTATAQARENDLQKLREMVKDIDFCMLTTVDEDG